MAHIKFDKSGSNSDRIYIAPLTKIINLVVDKLLPESTTLSLTIGFKSLPKNQNAVLVVKNACNNELTIHLNKNASFPIWALYLCHELVHAKQVFTGQLSFGINNDELIWNHNSEHVALSVPDSISLEADFDLYKNQPWEQEAYSMQNELYEFCKKNLSGVTIDLGEGLLIPLF